MRNLKEQEREKKGISLEKRIYELPVPGVQIENLDDKQINILKFLLEKDGKLDKGTTLKDAGALTREEITWDSNADKLSHKFAVLKQHCEDVGRPYEEIEKTATTYIQLSPDAMSTEEVLEICKKLNNVGCEHVVFNMPNVHEIEPLKIMGKEMIPKVSDL